MTETKDNKIDLKKLAENFVNDSLHFYSEIRISKEEKIKLVEDVYIHFFQYLQKDVDDHVDSFVDNLKRN